MRVFRFHPSVRALRRAALAAGTAALLLQLPASAQNQSRVVNDPLVDTVANGKGRINYGTGTVKATGYGALPRAGAADTPAQAKLMARGAALADALRTLAMTVSSVQVTSSTKVKNYQIESDEVSTQISAILQSPRIVSETFQNDGTAVVTVELPMYGENSVASAVLPEVLPKAEPNATTTNTFRGPDQPALRIEPPSAPRPITNMLGREPGPTPNSDPGPFSAVIVDCRGLGVEAIMSPKLYDTTGREIYGTLRVTPEYAIETGIVGYPRSMAEAVTSGRAGGHPLIVRAIRTADKFRFNPVISLEDGDRILATNRRDHYLEQTRVIFLVDPLK